MFTLSKRFAYSSLFILSTNEGYAELNSQECNDTQYSVFRMQPRNETLAYYCFYFSDISDEISPPFFKNLGIEYRFSCYHEKNSEGTISY